MTPATRSSPATCSPSTSGSKVGYVDFGNQKDSFGYDGGEGIFNVNVNAKANGNTLQLVGAYPLGPVDVFAKVGGISFNGNVSATRQRQLRQHVPRKN